MPVSAGQAFGTLRGLRAIGWGYGARYTRPERESGTSSRDRNFEGSRSRSTVVSGECAPQRNRSPLVRLFVFLLVLRRGFRRRFRPPEIGRPPGLVAASCSAVGALRERVIKFAERITTPLVPADYLDVIDPLRSGADLRGRIVDIRPETRDAVTVVIKTGRGWGTHRPASTSASASTSTASASGGPTR